MKTPALLFLASVILTCTTAFADKDIQDEIKELQATFEVLGEELEATVSLEETIKQRDEQRQAYEIEFIAMEEEIARIAKLRDVYRSAFRVVSNVSSGTPMNSLTLTDGSVIEGGTLIGASYRGLSIKSPSGPKTIAPDLLPENVRSAFAFPPVEESSFEGMTELYAARPDFMQLAEPVPAEIPQQTVASTPSPPAVPATPAAAPEETAQTVPLTERDAIALRNRERYAEINRLSTQISELRRQKNRVFRERGTKMTEIRQSNVKKSQRDQERILEPYNEKLAEIEDQEEELRSAIADIRLQWE